MNSDKIFIGTIIKQFRKRREMTLDTLSEGICSKDHLCIIEHNRCQPSLYLLNQISDKLKINLYDYYNNIISYESIENYLLVNEMFQYIYKYDLDNLQKFLDNNKDHPHFQSGELYKNYMYGKAVLESDLFHYDNSLQTCLDVFKKENIPLCEKNHLYNHIELLLLNLTAVNYHCLGNESTALEIYTMLYNQINHIILHSTFETYHHLHFETELFLNVCSNLAIIKLVNEQFNETESLLNTALEIGQNMQSTHCHCELLFCLCELYYYTNRISEAKQILTDVEVFARYEHKEHLYNEFIHNAKEMYPELFEQSNRFLISKGLHK